MLLSFTDRYIFIIFAILFDEMKCFFFSHLFIATRASVPSEAHATNITTKP